MLKPFSILLRSLTMILDKHSFSMIFGRLYMHVRIYLTLLYCFSLHFSVLKTFWVEFTCLVQMWVILRCSELEVRYDLRSRMNKFGPRKRANGTNKQRLCQSSRGVQHKFTRIIMTTSWILGIWDYNVYARKALRVIFRTQLKSHQSKFFGGSYDGIREQRPV